MAASGNTPPPKPWERAGSSSGPSPFRPSSSGPTSNVVESAGVAKPGEVNSNTENNASTVNRPVVNRPVPPRPWEQSYGGSYGNNYGGYGTMTNYGSGYGSGLYNGRPGYGGLYGSSLYGNGMYRGIGGMHNSGYGSMYNSGFGGPLGGYGMNGSSFNNNMNGGGPNGPFGGPPPPPSFWQSLLHVLQGVVSFLGRIAFLVDENTQALHFFLEALFMLFQRTGVLYGELVPFVLRLLGIRRRKRLTGPSKGLNAGSGEGTSSNTYYVEEPKEAPAGGWDNVWGNDGSRPV